MSRVSPIRLVVNNRGCTAPVSGVYLITDGGVELLDRVGKALRGGVSLLQYRAKGKEYQECLSEGMELKRLCAAFRVTFIVNDDIQLARDLDADGVHLGQDDGDVATARGLLPPGRIVGISTHNIEEARRAQSDGADYIGFGAIHPTGSKAVFHLPGVEGLKSIRDEIRIPIVAIGGIAPDNACRVIDAGANAIAVMSSVLSDPRPDVVAAELLLLFNRLKPFPRGVVLAVAGSDSGGGAGVQADIKTITLLGGYAASALSAVTVQNTTGVLAVHGLPPTLVSDQMNAVLSDIPVDVIKTGMLHTPAIINSLTELLSARRVRIPLVVDPVMTAKGGAPLLECDASRIICDQLVPNSYLFTPNIPEAERLLGRSIGNVSAMEQAAEEFCRIGAANVLIKGGHLPGGHAVDVLHSGGNIHLFQAERIFSGNTHGTGCSYASAIAALLAQGEPLLRAVELAKQFITSAIRHSRPLGSGHGPVNHYAASRELQKKLISSL